MAYATRLTKEDLINGGITEVTEDGRVFRFGKEVKPSIDKRQGYFRHIIYPLNENGERIKIPHPNSTYGYVYKTLSVGLHRLMWAWHHGEVPEGFVVDHINNKHSNIEDYFLSNLQLLTPADNVNKERDEALNKVIPCKLNRPREFYEAKLNKYMEEYSAAKTKGDAKAAHRLRCNISNIRAKLRYWDSHQGEAAELLQEDTNLEARRKARDARVMQLARFNEELKILHTRYSEARSLYGPSDPRTADARAKWKRGVQIANTWKAQHPAVRIKED